MKCILDTNALLWYLLDDPRLTSNARKHIGETSAEILVSPASLWEIAIKISLGKYALPEPFQAFWNEQFHLNNFSLLPISVEHAAQVLSLPFHHRDPFDRLIIAQAMVEDTPVVSSDGLFDRYDITRIW